MTRPPKQFTNLFEMPFIMSSWPRWEYDWGDGVCRIVYADKSLGLSPRDRDEAFTDETFFIQNAPPDELWKDGFGDWLDGITREHPKARPIAIANTVTLSDK